MKVTRVEPSLPTVLSPAVSGPGPKGLSGDKGSKGDPGVDSDVQGPPGLGLPPGGSPAQALRKVSADDYDTEWYTPQSSGSVIVKSGGAMAKPVGGGTSEIGGVTSPVDWALITNGLNAADSALYNLGALDLVAGRRTLIVASVSVTSGTAPSGDIVSNNLGTIVPFGDHLMASGGAGVAGRHRLMFFSAPVSGVNLTAEVLQLVLDGTAASAAWGVVQFLNTDVIQPFESVPTFADGTVPPGSLTLPAFGSVDNATFSVLSVVRTRTPSVGSGFEQVWSNTVVGTPELRTFAQFKETNDTSVDSPFSSVDGVWMLGAVEVRRA